MPWRRAEIFRSAERMSWVWIRGIDFLRILPYSSAWVGGRRKPKLTLLYPTISIRARLCLPRSGPAVTGAGDFAVIGSGAGSRIPLLAKEGYADLFCFTEGPSKAEVSTLSEPVGGRPPVNWKPLGFISMGVDAVGLLLAEMRARRERDASFGSLLVLIERARPSGRCCNGAFSAPGVPAVGGAPELGSSVWIKQQRLPYGQEPETQNV